MKRQKKGWRLLSLFLLVVLLAAGCGDQKQQPVENDLNQAADSAVNAGVAYVRSQLDLAAYNSDNDDMVFLLERAGLLTDADRAAYTEGLTAAIKSSWDLEKVTQWQKIAFAAAACGEDPSDQAGMDFLTMVLTYDVADENNEVDLYILNSKLLTAGAFGDRNNDARLAAEKLLALQNDDGAFVDEWGTTLDSTSLSLQALAASGLTEEEDIQQAVEQAVAYLSSQQDNDGSFLYGDEPSLSSTAQACTALAGLGIDPASDERFVKDDHSAWEALVTLYQKELAAEEQDADFYARTQGLMGLVACQRLHDEAAPYYSAGMFANAVQSASGGETPAENAQEPSVQTPGAEASGAEADAAPEASRQAESVTVAILGDEETILAPTAVAWEEGDTAYTVLKRAAQAQNISVEVSGSSRKVYVQGINDLYEFDKGATSGWLYQVNDAFPSKSASNYAVEAGDVVNWVYTLDMGKDVGAGQGAGQ